ncbi:hypothetical protein C8F01DRAFT_1081459 [Mycena amicta]|nr:hypothetical protein C8F01DRAFT_1081459 [Mycena amicta]
MRSILLHPAAPAAASSSGALPEPHRRRSPTACLNCRMGKTRCITSDDPPRRACKRCTQRSLVCEYTEPIVLSRKRKTKPQQVEDDHTETLATAPSADVHPPSLVVHRPDTPLAPSSPRPPPPSPSPRPRSEPVQAGHSGLPHTRPPPPNFVPRYSMEDYPDLSLSLSFFPEAGAENISYPFFALPDSFNPEYAYSLPGTPFHAHLGEPLSYAGASTPGGASDSDISYSYSSEYLL